MQRWQYLFLSAFYSGGGWSMKGMTGESLGSWSEITAHVSQAGWQGWELVSTAALNYPTGSIEYAMTFKRPTT